MNKKKEEAQFSPILKKMIEFRKDFYQFISIYLDILKDSYASKEKWNRLEELHTKTLLKFGHLKPLINELADMANIDLNSTWINAMNMAVRDNKKEDLSICLQATTVAIGKLEDDINKGVRDEQGKVIGELPKIDTAKPPTGTAEMPLYLFDRMQFHPKIINASRTLFEDEHYAQAIFEAFKAIENFVQDKSGLTLYGTNLMERVFNEENPIIKVPEAGYYYKEVQRGFKHLFIGASQGIRNPKAHKEIIQKDPYITLQYLGFFSFLLKRIDYWEADVS